MTLSIEHQEYINSVREIYQNCLNNRDFKTFSGFCKIYSDFKKDYINLRYEIWNEAQKKFERDRCGKDIVLKPRRVGFTTMELMRDLFFALTNPGSTTMIVTQEDSLGKESIAIIGDAIENLKDMEKQLGLSFVPKNTVVKTTQISFGTGSKIIYEVAKNQENSASRTGRGKGIARLHCTEVAFWSYPELTMNSLLFAASTADEIVIESTPKGASGYFYENYFKAKEGDMKGWKSHFSAWYEHSEKKTKFFSYKYRDSFDFEPKNDSEDFLINKVKISREQLNWYRQKVDELGLERVLQELPNDDISCFRMKSQTFLSEDDFSWISSCVIPPIAEKEPKEFVHDLERLRTTIKIYEFPKTSQERYIVGADVSYGSEQDYSSFYVISAETGKIAACFRDNSISTKEFGQLLAKIGLLYNNALMAVERQAGGKATLDELETQKYFNLYKDPKKDYYGWNTSSATRTPMFLNFQTIIREKSIPILDKEIYSECRTLILDKEKIEHASGYHDDCLISYMIALYVRKEIPFAPMVGYQSIKRSRINGLNVSLRNGRFGNISIRH